MSSKAVWYLMRGTGVTSLLLLTGVVVLGILTSRKTSLPTLPRFATMTLHRSISLLAVLFLGIHVITAVADPYAQVRLLDTVVRTLWLRGLALAMLATIAAALTWRLGAAPATPDRRTTSSVGGHAPG